MNTKRLFRIGLAIALLLVSASIVLAAGDGAATRSDPQAGGTLVDEVRRATERFKDVSAAEAAGYGLFHGCVSGPEEGAMGVHFVNGDLVGDGQIDPAKPEALIYEWRDGRFRLVGVEYVVIAEAWDAANATPPVLMGQLFNFGGSPNRYGIPAFYELHVWAWKHNPDGMFADWNSRVSCAEFTGDAAHTSEH